MIDAVPAALPRTTWTVAALVHAVADTLASRFAVCAVRGELSAFSRAASGHCYFGLKDADGEAALLRCAMFRRSASLLDFSPGDGQLVDVRGRLAVYEPRGELQFIVESMQRAGAGALYEQFLRLRTRLEAEGLFDPQRKRALPSHPRCIGVVTSLGAAALHDVVTALRRRACHVQIVLYPSLVQGPDAPGALVAAIAQANRHAVADVLILCRGGGSLEDLWSFNDERVVRSVATSALPVVCGVGHETDVTLCDFAADVRAPTPTAAAEIAAPPTGDCLQALATLEARMRRRTRHVVDVQAQRLDACAMRLARPTRVLQRHGQLLALLGQRLASGAHRALDRRRLPLPDHAGRLRRAVQAVTMRQSMKLDAAQVRLDAVDPKNVLARGYAWLADETGTPVQSVERLAPGQALDAVLADGSARVAVERITRGDAP
jgi:exodeoxyribonuclease VII large subunit